MMQVGVPPVLQAASLKLGVARPFEQEVSAFRLYCRRPH